MANEEKVMEILLLHFLNVRPKTDVINPLVQVGYPNRDTEANLEDEVLKMYNPGKDLKDFYNVAEDTLKLKKGAKFWMDCGNGNSFLFEANFPALEDTDGYYCIKKGGKETLAGILVQTSQKPQDALEVKAASRWGGGQIQAERTYHEILSGLYNTKEFLYHLSAKGSSENDLDNFLEKDLGINSLTYNANIPPRVNAVFFSVKCPNGTLDDKVIAKHKFDDIKIDYNTFETQLNKAFIQNDKRKNGTIFLNGVKYKDEIEHSIQYAQNRGIHLISIITDSTAKHRQSVIGKLIPNSTYISNEDELGILTGALTVVKYGQKSHINIDGILEGIRRVREWQKDTPQNIYVTLGELGSISINKEGDLTWVSKYDVAYNRKPNTNGFGDAYASAASLLEHFNIQYGFNLDATQIQKVATAVVASKVLSTNNEVSRDVVENLMKNNQPVYSHLGRVDYKGGKASLNEMNFGNLKLVFDYFYSHTFL